MTAAGLNTWNLRSAVGRFKMKILKPRRVVAYLNRSAA
jgi:hypothetical protein